MIIHSQAPTRVDLAGGTLDIWPLYLFHKNSQTVNFAINYHARCQVTPRRGGMIELISHDQNTSETFQSLGELASAKRFRLPLLARLVMVLKPASGLRLETRAESPAGAGLGGSSALNIAVCGALSRLAGKKLAPAKLIELARNVEAQVLGIPTGEQDYYSAVFGGVQSIHLDPDGVRQERLAVNQRELAARVVLCYTGQSRNSGINNWGVMKAHLDGSRAVGRQFDHIAHTAAEMRDCLQNGDWKRTARLIHRDWEARKKNYPGITTDRIEQLMLAARKNGAVAGKVCGAGGGGCVMFLIEPERKARVEAVLRDAGARVMPLKIAGRGLQVRVEET